MVRARPSTPTGCRWPANRSGSGRIRIRRAGPALKQVAAILDRLDPPPTVRFIEPTDLDLEPKEDAFDFIEQCWVAGMDPKQAVMDVMERAKSLSLSSGLRDRIEDTISGKWADVSWPWPKLTRLSRALLPPDAHGHMWAARFRQDHHGLQVPSRVVRRGNPHRGPGARRGPDVLRLQRVLAIREGNIELLDPDWQKANPDEARAAYAKHQTYLDRFGRRIFGCPLEPMSLDAISAWVRDSREETE